MKAAHGVAEATERSGGKVCPPPLRSCRQLRGRVTVDVLVDPARVRAEIATPEAEGTFLRLDRIEGAALVDVGGRGVLVLRRLSRIRPLDGVTPVGPGSERKASKARDRQVIPAERHGPVVELLEVPVRDRVGDLDRSRPAYAVVTRCGGEDVERRHGGPIRAVTKRPDRRVARVMSAVPPECV